MDGLTGNGSLPADVEVVGAASTARAQGEPDAEYAFRQSLVDGAAVSELLAADLPRPTLPRDDH